ncbi:hypothetical protein [Nocardiopsis halotolerans]|uniref:hypothetical protein n=1 Tax=Nocardiopsis halotolerans TaxID=124252 RepID=UPI000347C795|nr:hypothetical protein [Nocardiopsis halotolerans]
MSVDGTWDLTITTPVGRLRPTVRITGEGGELTGTALGAGEEVELTDLALDGDRLTWRQAVTRPMRLDLAFDLTVEGDRMAGTSRAGRLPASSVVARRRTDDGSAEANGDRN